MKSKEISIFSVGKKCTPIEEARKKNKLLMDYYYIRKRGWVHEKKLR